MSTLSYQITICRGNQTFSVQKQLFFISELSHRSHDPNPNPWKSHRPDVVVLLQMSQQQPRS